MSDQISSSINVCTSVCIMHTFGRINIEIANWSCLNCIRSQGTYDEDDEMIVNDQAVERLVIVTQVRCGAAELITNL